MPIQFKTGKPEPTETCVDPGDYKLRVIDAVEDTSKAGNDMIKLRLRVLHEDGREGPAFYDYLVFNETTFWKIDHFLKACGQHPGEGCEIDLDVRDLVGWECDASLKVETYEGVRDNIHHDASPAADDWLDTLFPEAEWLCLAGDHPSSARTRRRERWRDGPASQCSLIVPSPMTAPSGRGLDGRQSHRCLDNTGPRRWLVIEFDQGSIDQQALLHWHLAAAWPLVLCVHSAGKSLHGWYGPFLGEQRARELMEYAVSLGADPATWNRCQLVRLPGGVRAGRPLEVFYFNPDPCLSPTNSTAPGAPAASTPLRAPMAR